ncbi:mechanosensitive ion channel domain-containing protein [uncultured Ferrimonas sp.]|uniref:mechanosensitive ion channel domain-containing protein n=1 Tax=uncultured Ferrimonas sp. TaxID=432640 RepID=UPI00261461CC|nr:mechanosensitive ion channel domain-containing protein [uncultured Ferrimonas sp.]
MKKPIAVCWLLLSLLFMPALAETDGTVDIDQVTAKLERLQGDPDGNQEEISKLEQTLESLNQLNNWLSQTNALQQQTDPALRAAALAELEQLQQQPTPALAQDISIDQLEVLLANNKARASEIAEALTQLSDARQALLLSQQQLPNDIARVEQQQKVAQQSLSQTQADDLVNLWLAQTTVAERRARLQLLRLQQSSLVVRQEASKVDQQLYEHRQRDVDLLIDTIQQRLLSASEKSGQRMLNRAKRLTKKYAHGRAEIITRLDEISQLAQDYDELGINSVLAQQQRQRLQSIRQQTGQTLAQIKENIGWLQRSPAFSDAIRAQLKRLPLLDDSKDVTPTLAAAHLTRFTLSQLLSQLSSSEKPLFNNEAEQQAVAAINSFKGELLNLLIDDYDQYIAVLTELDALQLQVNQEIASEKAFLREKQLFLQGRAALWQLLPQPLNQFFGVNNWPLRIVAVQAYLAKERQSLLWLSLLAVVGLGLALKIAHLATRYQQQIQSSLGHVIRDRFRFTLMQVGFACLYSGLIIGWIMVPFVWTYLHYPYFATLDLYHILLAPMVLLFTWSMAIRLCHQGVFEEHFHWSSAASDALRTTLQRFRWGLYLLLLAMALVEMVAEEAESSALRLTFIATILWLMAAYLRLLHHRAIRAQLPLPWQQFGWRLVSIAVILPMLASIFLAASGYFYAAWITMYYFHALFLLLAATLFVHQLGARWLRIEQRRLAYQRAQERLQLQQEDGSDAIIEQNQPVAELNAQSALVLNIGSFLLFIVLVTAVLTNTELAFQWMQNVVVWEVINADAGGALEQVTLQSALAALTVLLLCFFAAKNLTGVLELLVFQHLNLSKGASYAITSLLRYFLIVVGLAVGLSTLGLHWSKLQWLVAALGVGLGFGLQEIFANLVSGLILLFERPVRVGDTITINNLTGTVTKINTRATTIMDWDKKEIVVPNKSLITDQLINWSLSDGTTRLVLPIGVAYGSNVALVKQLLLQVAAEHDDVLTSPEPLALFSQFGDSALLFELRVFLGQLDNLSVVRDQLNTAIDAQFRRAEVVMAFPQLDVHLHHIDKP